MRLAYYVGASTAAAAACLLKAFHQRPNFYSATVYLAQSNACLLILTNLLLVLACAFIYALQRLLYGRLRPIEIEQLSEKAWYAVLDTLLAMPSFREDVGGWLLTMFVLLLCGKVWGWIGEGRVDILEQQPPANPRLFHLRLATSLSISVVFDLCMLDFCIETVMADPRPGMMVIFTFEFAILTIFSLFTLSRYCLVVWEAMVQKQQMAEAIETRKSEIRAERIAARSQETQAGGADSAVPLDEDPIEVDENEVDVPGWEDKRRYLFALEVFSDFIKLMIYIFFFAVSITFNGLPMHIMRDVYMTFASFSKRVTDYVAYRKATSDMNTRYADATTEEIRGDACIVCRENMLAWEQPNAQPQADAQAAPAAPAVRRDEGLRAKKLPCGHILHLRCLKAWLERQQVCPTCRRPVVTAETTRAGGPPGAPGANPPAPGQQGQQRPPRQNRARIFNLGPLRVGFLNGPGDQIQNIVNQMRDPAAPGQNPAQEIQQAAFAGAGGARAQIPTYVQLLQIEQRILQDAYNLGIEQQQLALLRMMEMELARLRATQLSNQPPLGTTTAAQRQAMNIRMPGTNAIQHGFAAPPPRQETLHGNPTQQIGNGHEGLPQGLVLPEGWTMMPLQRADGGGLPTTVGVQASSQPPNGFVHVGPAPTPTISVPSQAGVRSLPTRSPSANGPTDSDGSPLFIPTSTPAEQAPSFALSADNSSNPPTTSEPSTARVPPASWTNSNGWGFEEAAADVDPSSSSSSTTKPASSTEPRPRSETSEREAESRALEKGKGRAVEMEEAEDSEL